MNYRDFSYGTKEYVLWYRRNKDVVPRIIYSTQKKSSIKRGHKLPEYTVEWLVEWMLNSDRYHKMYHAWVNSGYDRNTKPTIDRIDDSIGYTKDNIQLLTWEENRSKGHIERVKSNQNTPQGKLSVPISTVRTKDGKKFIFKSVSEAARTIKSSRGNIQMCLSKKYKRQSSKGFNQWRYEDV